MTAKLTLIASPSGASNTERLLARWRDLVAPESWCTVLWLGPTRRFLDTVRRRMVADGQSVLAPLVMTIQQFADEVVCRHDAAARPLAAPQRRLLIDHLLADLDRRGRLPAYRGFLDTRSFPDLATAFLTELQQHAITPEQLAAVDGGAREEQCATLYAAYDQQLRRLGLYPEEARVRRAAELLHDNQPLPFWSCQAVFVDGFADFTPPQRQLLVALAASVDELWITLPDAPADEREELFRRSRRTRQHLQAFVSLFQEKTTEPAETRPSGLIHLQQQLFRSRKTVMRSTQADGLLCLEAPGPVGEARMVARALRRLLDQGTRPDDVLVTVRDLVSCADLLREVFGEYDLPIDIEGAEPLYRNPAVATLLRALRLPDEDWPFAAVTALLRSGYFRPDWPEVQVDPSVVQHSEALLRLLGEPRGRDAYLKLVKHWAVKVHPGLEDEQALESRRQRTHDLAVRCGGFLERFFHAWDQMPARGTLEQWGTWLRQLADDLGLRRTAAEAPRDAAALDRLELELLRWAQLHQRLAGETRLVDRSMFFRQLGSLAVTAGLAHTPRGDGRIRILSAELACGLDVDHLFVMGLGERSFPRLTVPNSLLDEQQRQRLREAGLEIACAEERLADEMLLFFRLVTAARRQLVLSFPAVDDKGQALLPSSFLSAVRDCFTAGAIPVQRRRMLIEGYDSDEPLSAAELRVHVAASRGRKPPEDASASDGLLRGLTPPARQTSASDGLLRGLTPPARQESASDEVLRGLTPPARQDLIDNLLAARDLAQQRFHSRDFSAFDGWLRDPAVVADLQKRFGPDRILSPTALENYIACPFKFLLRNALGLEPLEEPAEEIESTDRGLAFHRALSRLHQQLRSAGVHQPDAVVETALLERLDQAFTEQGSRASPAAEVLWNLEGQRLKRFGLLYRAHWQDFLAPWLERGIQPQPRFFEAGFGLPAEADETPHPPLTICLDNIEVRISGRIDRVDVADLPDGGVGYWVIDYKTGRSGNYTSKDLQEFRKLQLTLYALAAEQVLLGDRPARPLGMAYWLVVDGGAKLALPGHPRKAVAWCDETAAWGKVRTVLQRWVVQLVTGIRQGEFPLKPRSDLCMQTCDYGPICRISQVRAVVERKTWQLPLPTIG